MAGMFSFWLPLTQLFIILWALMAMRARRLPGDFRYGMRLLRWAEPWSMVPVLMLGLLVAIVKFSGFATIEAGPGIWAFALLTFLLAALSRLTAHRLWRHAEVDGLGEGVPEYVAAGALCGSGD